MKVLVTGAAGFIGSHLTEKLLDEGHDVRAFVRYNSRNGWGWLENNHHPNLEVYSGDIRDYDSVHTAMKAVDAVFHLAALIGIPYSYVSPIAYIKTNIEGTYNVLQSARELGVRVIHTSTSEIYGTAQYVPIDEKHPVNPQSPYAATKSGADQLALTYHRSFDTPVVVVRPFNTYGPRQSARAIIPTIISQALSGAKVIKLGNLTPTRDLNYVTDTASGFIKVGMSDKAIGKVINLGTGKEITIGDLAEKILSLVSSDAKIECETQRLRPQNSEVERLCSNADMAKEVSEWSPEVSLDEGIKKTIEWIKANLSTYKPSIYNV